MFRVNMYIFYLTTVTEMFIYFGPRVVLSVE